MLPLPEKVGVLLYFSVETLQKVGVSQRQKVEVKYSQFGVNENSGPQASVLCVCVSMYVCVSVCSVSTFSNIFSSGAQKPLGRLKPNFKLGLGNESLFKQSWSHDQDGHHALIW